MKNSIADFSISPLNSFNDFGLIELAGFDKFQNNIYYLVSLHGLYSFNENSQTNTVVQEICDTRHIRSFSISKVTGNILIEEVKRTKVDEFGGVDYFSSKKFYKKSWGIKRRQIIWAIAPKNNYVMN